MYIRYVACKTRRKGGDTVETVLKEALTGDLVPVLLGTSPETQETAQRLFRQYGVVSHVFCEKIPLPLRLSLSMKFHPIPTTSGEQLMLQALLDFSSQLEHADVIPYLIPCTEHYAHLVWQNRDTLECRFLLADRAGIEKVWFGKYTEKEVQKDAAKK